MRFLIAVVLAAIALPSAEAAAPRPPKRNCDRCASEYQFCLNRARTKQARKSCKVSRKNCKKAC